MGSRKHRRLPRWQGWIPKFVLAFDFALLLYFFAGITNVYWQNPVSMNLAFAVILAGMVTVLAYGFLSFTGHRMRSYKNHAGTVHLDELDGFTKAAFGTAIVVIAVLAALMYLRIHSEVIDALRYQAGVTALVIPLAVAVVSAVANYLVVLIHALDGSDEVARLDKLAAATRRPSARRTGCAGGPRSRRTGELNYGPPEGNSEALGCLPRAPSASPCGACVRAAQGAVTMRGAGLMTGPGRGGRRRPGR